MLNFFEAEFSVAADLFSKTSQGSASTSKVKKNLMEIILRPKSKDASLKINPRYETYKLQYYDEELHGVRAGETSSETLILNEAALDASNSDNEGLHEKQLFNPHSLVYDITRAKGGAARIGHSQVSETLYSKGYPIGLLHEEEYAGVGCGGEDKDAEDVDVDDKDDEEIVDESAGGTNSSSNEAKRSESTQGGSESVRDLDRFVPAANQVFEIHRNTVVQELGITIEHTRNQIIYVRKAPPQPFPVSKKDDFKRGISTNTSGFNFQTLKVKASELTAIFNETCGSVFDDLTDLPADQNGYVVLERVCEAVRGPIYRILGEGNAMENSEPYPKLRLELACAPSSAGQRTLTLKLRARDSSTGCDMKTILYDTMVWYSISRPL